MNAVGLLWIECKQMYSSGMRVYLLDNYNLLDFIVLSLYLASYMLRSVVSGQYSHCGQWFVVSVVSGQRSLWSVLGGHWRRTCYGQWSASAVSGQYSHCGQWFVVSVVSGQWPAVSGHCGHAVLGGHWRRTCCGQLSVWSVVSGQRSAVIVVSSR